jgi:hypothetical protein
MKRSSEKGSSRTCQWWDVVVPKPVTCGKPATHRLPNYLLEGDLLVCADHTKKYLERHPHNVIQPVPLAGTGRAR